jgi:hypothetical protein
MNKLAIFHKTFLVLFFFFSSFAVIFGQSPTPSSEEYELKSSEGNFSIKFPSKPNNSTSNLKIANTELQLHSYDVNEQGKSFGVIYVDFPASFPAQNKDSFFDGAISNLERQIASNGGKITSQDAINFKGCKGREIKGSSSNIALLQGRIFSSGQRFYLLLCLFYSKSPNMEESVDKFFNSFEIVGGCLAGVAAIEVPSEPILESSIEGVDDPQTNWKKLSIEKDSFSVLMPGTTRLREEKIQINPFPLYAKSYESSIKDKDIECKVLVTGDYPEDLYSDDSRRQVALDVAYNSFKRILEKEESKIEFVRNLKIEKFPGREYVYSLRNRNGKLQIFVTTKKVYVFIAISDSNNNPDFDKFFKSIRLLID